MSSLENVKNVHERLVIKRYGFHFLEFMNYSGFIVVDFKVLLSDTEYNKNILKIIRST